MPPTGICVLTIPNARPVAFSPSGDILLLIEAAPDDDCRHFLIEPRPDAKIPPFGQRKRIGGRYVTSHAWTDEGRSLKLTTPREHGGAHEETITVADHLSCAPAQPKP